MKIRKANAGVSVFLIRRERRDTVGKDFYLSVRESNSNDTKTGKIEHKDGRICRSGAEGFSGKKIMRNRRPSPRGKDVAKRGNPLRPLRVVAILLFCAFIFPVLPKMQLNAAHTFSSGPVVITQETVDTYGREFIIENGVFSVTVTDGVDVTIIFDNVKIDRRNDTPESVPSEVKAQLLEAAKKLNSDSLSEDSKWELYYSSYYIPTCPLLITGGASVTARFAGSCSFYAGFNGWYISENVGTTQNAEVGLDPGGGYAGIQVDSGSSLTIASADDLRAVGAYQFITDMNDSTTVQEIIDKNTIYDPIAPWARPAGCEEGVTGGGAGIGGGVSYNNQKYGLRDYLDGTPGRITINGGNITAVGGHQAAGIGGGVNSASTSSEIVINGGEITAIGGRFATGVGDGDSHNGETDGGTSGAYLNDHSITVNGGRLHAYGGTSAAGLGTTDHVSSSQGFQGSYHGLEITVNGGTVYATSGEATAPDSATAAVGSGEGTNMQDNSITINSQARVIGASFSQYAISNYGTNASSTPMIHIDPLGYMYLVRFDSATQDRVFSLYPVRKDVNGNRMYVAARSSAVSSINAENYKDYLFYAYDPDAAPDAPKYYRVDGLGYTVDKNGERSNERYYPAIIEENLSVFYDFSAPIGTLTVPGKYKAIAMSLFDPSLFGGAYVLEVPKEDTQESSIFVSIVKDSPGVTSGRVEYTGDYHVIAGENGKNEETPNISIDKTANGFKDISLYVQGTDTDYITEFSPSTYGYTVYLPYGTTKFTIHSEYALSDAVRKVTIDGTGLKIRELIYEEDKEGDGVMKNDVDLSVVSIDGYDGGDFWIRKEDTDGTYIVYRIVVNVKKMYTLELAGSDKVYDGVAAQGRAEGISEGPDGQTQGSGLPQLTDQDRAQIVYTWYRDANGNGTADDTDELLTQPPRNAGSYVVRAYLEAQTFEAGGELSFEISKREITLNAIENWTAYFSLEELDSFDGYIKNPGKLFFGNVVAGESITVDDGFSVKFTDTGKIGYEDDVGYSLDKIEVSSLVLTGDSALNYTLVPDVTQDDGSVVFLVYGQITYKTDGAIFRKVLDAATPFRKFYPVDSDTFLDFENNDPRIDYHSPSSNKHRDYVYLHTVNKGESEAVYAVDIEFGTMQFSYSKTTWSVDDYNYVDNDGSVWSGNDGVSNSVRVINYSNRDISFQVSAQIDFIYGPVGGNQNSGITCSLQIDDGDAAVPVKDGESLLVPMATPASTESAGVPGERCVEVVLSGVPQIGENVLTAVGKVTVMVSRDVLQGSYAGTGGGSA